MALMNGQKDVRYELAEEEFRRPFLTSWFFALGVLSLVFTAYVVISLIGLTDKPTFAELSHIYVLGFALFTLAMGQFVVAAVIYYLAKIAFEAKQQTFYSKGLYAYARRQDKRADKGNEG